MHTVFGRILDPEGNPVPDVQVTWEGFTQAAPRGIEEWPTGRRERLASVKTEADGRFRCQAMFAADRYSFTSLPIRSERYGFRARHVDMKKLDEPIEVSLEETYPIEGTILSSTAEPVVGARVLIRRVHRYDVADPREANWSRGLEQPEHYSKTYPDYWPAPVTTDAEGRFRIEGIVPLSAACELEISRDGYPPTVVHIAGKESKRDRTWEYTDSKFTLVLEDPLIVHGRFTDEKSGEGIAGVKVDVMPFTTGHGGSTLDRVETTSDVEGRYMLRWGRADSHWLRVFPPLGYAGMTDSISAKDVEKLTVKPGVVDYPVKLRPGKVIRGKVIVEGTDEPVADVEVVYHGVRNRKYGTNNDFLPVKTAVDGSFELTGADGQGFLLVNAPKRGFYREHFTHERLFNRNGIYPHGYLEVDIPTEKNAEGFVVPVRHGAVLTIHCLDPSGKPAGNLMAAHAEQEFDGRFQTTYCAGNEYLIDAARPERTYRVFLYSRDSNSGKVVELVAPVDGQPVDVKLEPCATIRGRYVYENGTGVSEVANASHFRMDPSKPLDGDRIYDLPFYDNFAQSHDRKGRVTDSEGNFRLDNIVPGVFMYLSINYPFADGKHFREVGMLAPGEVKDLGEMVLRPN